MHAYSAVGAVRGAAIPAVFTQKTNGQLRLNELVLAQHRLSLALFSLARARAREAQHNRYRAPGTAATRGARATMHSAPFA